MIYEIDDAWNRKCSYDEMVYQMLHHVVRITIISLSLIRKCYAFCDITLLIGVKAKTR